MNSTRRCCSASRARRCSCSRLWRRSSRACANLDSSALNCCRFACSQWQGHSTHSTDHEVVVLTRLFSAIKWRQKENWTQEVPGCLCSILYKKKTLAATRYACAPPAPLHKHGTGPRQRQKQNAVPKAMLTRGHEWLDVGSGCWANFSPIKTHRPPGPQPVHKPAPSYLSSQRPVFSETMHSHSLVHSKWLHRPCRLGAMPRLCTDRWLHNPCQICVMGNIGRGWFRKRMVQNRESAGHKLTGQYVCPEHSCVQASLLVWLCNSYCSMVPKARKMQIACGHNADSSCNNLSGLRLGQHEAAAGTETFALCHC